MAATESRLAATGESMRRAGRSLTTSLTLPIIATAAAAVDMGIHFQQQLEMIHTQAGASQAEVNRLSQAVLSLAPSTRYGPEELVKALYHIESVGARGSGAMSILKVAAQGAAVGNADLEATASALVGTMRVYHVPFSRAASVMADLNAIVGAGNMRMQDLNNAIGTGLLPTAQGMGLSMREAGAALAVMTDESVPAQVAATRLRTLLLMMSGETKKSSDTLKELGINSLQMGHLMHTPGGMIPALQLLKTHLDAITKDPTLQTQFLAKAFGGARSSGTIIQLLNNLEFVRTKLDQINRTAGNFPEDVLRTQQTEVFKLHSAWAAVQAVLIQIGGILAPFISQMAAGLARFLQGFQTLNPELQKIIVFGSLIVAALGPAIFIVGTVMTTMSALGSVVAALLTPVGLVVAAVAVLVAGFILLYRNSETFRNAVSALGGALRTDGIAIFNALRGVVSALASAFSGLGVTWRGVGQAMSGVLNTLRNAANAVTSFVVSQFNLMASGIRAHSAEIRSFVTAAWNAIVTITRTVWPIIRQVIQTAWDAIKIIVSTALRVIGNVILAVMDAIHGNWSGAWNAIKAATSALLHGIVALIEALLRGLIPVVLSIASQIGLALWNGIKKIAGYLARLPGMLIGLISSAIHAAAGAAESEAGSIGSAIVSGILGGVGGLAGSLAGKLQGMIGGALGSVKGMFGIHSPSTVTQNEIGKPLGEGIIRGFLLGAQDLPTKMSDKIRTALEALQRVVQTQQSKVQSAFQRLSDYAMKAFDARTTQHLNAMQATFDEKIKRMVTDPLDAALAAASDQHDQNVAGIQGARDALTPAEAQLKEIQDAHDAAQRLDAIQKAQAALALAQQEGDNEKILAAQSDLNDALYADKIANLQKTADAERTAQNAQADTDSKTEDNRYKIQQDGLQARFDALKASLQATYDTNVLNYQSERDLQSQNLQDQLTNLSNYLALHPEEWNKVHAKIMGMFKDSFGPDYKTAGKNLGVGFAQGIRQSFTAITKSVVALANILKKHLKLKSPAEEGPLADLDTWWDSFVPTIWAGIDTGDLDRRFNALLAPYEARLSGLGGASGYFMLNPTDAPAGPSVNIENLNVNNSMDELSVARTIARNMA